MLLLSLNQQNNNTTVTQSLYSPLVKFRGQRLTSVLSLERRALLPLLAMSLDGTTVICCTGMLLFPGNAPELLPQHSQSCPPICVPAWDLFSRPQARS